jgi:hypothetical protein
MSNYTHLHNVKTRAIQDGWIEFAERLDPWHLFGHFTFVNYPRYDFADRMFRRFINRANKVIYGCNHRRRGQGLCWLRGTEYQKRGSLHFHALISGEDLERWNTPDGRLELMWLWENTHPETGFSRIYPFLSGAKVYAAKYCSKDVTMDFFVSPKKLDQMRRSAGAYLV